MSNTAVPVLDSRVEHAQQIAMGNVVIALRGLDAAQATLNVAALRAAATLVRIVEPEITHLDVILVGPPSKASLMVEAYRDADQFVRPEPLDPTTAERVAMTLSQTSVSPRFMESMGATPLVKAGINSERSWRFDIDRLTDWGQ